MQKDKIGTINLPRIIFGTSSLGNLFVALDEETKCAIIKEYVGLSNGPVVFDSAGKYGAGLALEVLGKCLKQLDVRSEEVIISNKLGWVRTELKTQEPTFEPGVWKDLRYDAIQKISYDGIVECFEQGNELLDGYIPQMVSVHDPDEYLAAASNEGDAQKRYNDVLEAYRALYDLKREGKVEAVGVGAKDWKMIQRIAADVPLDWVMIANSLTIKNHPRNLLNFVTELDAKGVTIINSAVFHSGFLAGGDYFDYKLVTPGTPKNDALLAWRNEFFNTCKTYDIKPATACVQFALQLDGIKSIALSTTNPERVKTNLEMVHTELPMEFWRELKAKGLIVIDLSKNTQLA